MINALSNEEVERLENPEPAIYSIGKVQKIDIDLPEPFQDLFLPMRYKVYHGGRGSAKSWSIARALILRAMGAKERILCAREFQNSIKDSSLKLLSDQIEMMGFSEYFKITRNEITCLITGTLFIFSGLWNNPQKIKSMEGITICWVEEANNVSQTSLDLLIPTIRAEDSEIWFSFNRNMSSDPVDKMFLSPEGLQRTNAVVHHINYDQNPYFTEILRDEMEYDKKHDYEKFEHVWKGMPVKHSEARVFKKWKVDGSIAPSDNETFYYGADWGFANDPTTLVRCWADHEKRIIYIDQEAYGVGVEIDDTPEMFRSVDGSEKWMITADSARPETISYMKRNGFRMRSAKKGKGSVEEGIKFLQSYSIVIHERCKHVIDEFKMYCYKTDKLTGEILPILGDNHNHLIDALRYALEKLAFKRAMINIG